MKTKLRFVFLGLALLASLAQTQILRAATFTVTPPTVNNTYNGAVTLKISGLATGETVVVKKYLDANGNGVIDAGDWLVQQFSLTDGNGGMVIGGVTNFNVPGDTDTTAGQITAKLNFQNGDISQSIVAPYLFEVSSPTGSFSPITKPFSVTSFPYAQKFTGNVVSNNTSTTLPDAVVLLFPPPAAGNNGGSGPVGGAVANSSGVYSIQAPAGTYSLVAVRSNFVADMQEASDLVLAAGATVPQNVDLHSTTLTISGKIIDTNTGVGLGGMLIPVEAGSDNSKNLLAIGFTDTDGKFAVGVTSNMWGIDNDSTGLAVSGYVALNNKMNVDATAGSVSGVTIALSKATALIYGSVKDNLGNPFVGMDISAYDSTNMYDADAFTDANGNYVLGVLGLGTNDEWYVQANGKNAITNYVFSQQNQSTNLNAGQAVLENITGLLATHYIVGTVIDSSNNPISGVGVNANENTNGLDFSAHIDTDTNGNYSLLVANGTWNISVNCYGGNDSLGGNYACPNMQSATISGNNATNNFVVQYCGGISIGTTFLPPGEVNQNYDQFLQASSCAGNFSWSLVSGSLPSSLNWTPNGEIYGTPTNASTNSFTFNVTDGNNLATNQLLSLTIYPQLQVTNTSLPNATLGVPYSQTLQAGGGLAPYTWSLSPGSSTLPPGLGLTNGIISGIPAINGGPFGFSVRVTDNLGYTSDQPLFLTIVCSGVIITTTSLPVGEVNVPYFQSLQASSCSSTFNWSLFSGSLPPGLTLATNGVISGTPTNNVTNSFTVNVIDGNDLTTNQQLSLTILAPVQVTTMTLPNGANGAFYFQALQATGGLPPYTWSLSPGSATLPAGLGLTNGVISGIPATNGGFGFAVRVTDNLGGMNSRLLSLTIAPPPLQILTTNLPPALQSLPYTNALSATGGQPPYTWTSTGLPAGLTLATNGVISGALTNVGSNSFTVRVTDALSDTTNQLLSLIVNLAQGSLQVTIQPAGAVTNGAKWQVDGGPWKTSGAIVSGLSVATNHTLAFNVIYGWSAPSNQMVAITSGMTNQTVGLYTTQKVKDAALAIAITSPKPAQVLSLTTNVVTVTGTARDTLPAKDNMTVKAVYYQANGGSWTLATPFNKSWSDWTATVTALAGANNTVSAYAVDSASNASPITEVTFKYIPSAILTVATTGSGAVNPNFYGKPLPIGASYILTPSPGHNWIFSNWVVSGSSNFTSTNTDLKITVQSGLRVTGNFVTNVFLAVQSIPYNGLFAPTNTPRQQTNSGAITFTVTSTGSVSGRLFIGTNTPSLTGQFSPAGAATIITPRKGLTTLTTTLQLDFANQTATGSITDGGFDAQVIADLQLASFHYDGQYTLTIPGTNSSAVGPFGTSYGTVTVRSGTIAFGGSLADGTSVSQSSHVSKDGYWPCYLSLYNGNGSLWGWNLFTQGTIISAANASWINATNPAKTALYRAGFTNLDISIVASAYNPARMPLLALTNGDVLLDGGNLLFPIINQFALASNNTITLTNTSDTNRLALTIKTGGIITGTFADPSNPKEIITVNGVLLQNETNAQGYFPGVNQSGTFILKSP